MSLRYAYLNILLAGDGEARALYRLEPVSYPYLPAADKLALLSAWMRWLLASRVDWSLWRVFRGYPAARYPAEAQAMLDPRRQDPAVWEAYLAGHAETLAHAQPYHPEIYLAVRLSRAEVRGLWADARRALRRARRRIERAGGVEAPRPIGAAELRADAAHRNSPPSLTELPHPVSHPMALSPTESAGLPRTLVMPIASDEGAPPDAHTGGRRGGIRTAKAGVVDLGHRPPPGP